MMRLTRLLPILSVSAFAILSFQTIPYAQAGFQWVPPENETPVVTTPAPAPAMPAPSFPQTGDVMPMPSDVLVPMVIKPRGNNPATATAPPRPLAATPSAPVYNEPIVPSYQKPYEAEPQFVPLREKTIAKTSPMQTKVITPRVAEKPAEIMRPQKLKVPEMPAYIDSTPSTLPAPSYEDDRKTAQKDSMQFTNFFGDKKTRSDTIEDDRDGGNSFFKWMDLDTDKSPAEESWESGKLNPALTPVTRKTEPRMVQGKTVTQGQYAIVEGFGSDLPLALALSQVVPPQYSYSFGSGVNPGLRVSWNGGKPWNDVVNDMVKSLNLSATISGKILYLKQTSVSHSSLFQSEGAPVYKTASVKRNNIMDPGEDSAIDESVLMPLAGETKEKTKIAKIENTEPPPLVTKSDESKDTSADANDSAELAKPPPMVQDDIAVQAEKKQNGEDFNFKFEDSYPEKAAKRPKLSKKIQKDIEQENIEMRMSAAASDEILPPTQPYQPGRSYELDGYKKPLYGDDPLPEFATAQDMEKKATKVAVNTTPELPDVTTTPKSVSQKKASLNQGAAPANKVSAADVKMWEAQKGDSLKQTLVNWSREANINLVWNAQSDYTISSNVLVNGTFKTAIKTMFAEGLPVESKPSMRFVDNPSADEPTTFIVGDRV